MSTMSMSSVNPSSIKPISLDETENIDPLASRKKLNQSMRKTLGSKITSYRLTGASPGKGPLYYLVRPNELRDNHPVWHYFYLCTLIFAAFVALFVGPVLFGLLAAVGGIGTPFILSIIGSGIGLLLGLIFGVIFGVVCIVALVRVVGWAADRVLETLSFGGNDLWDLTKQQILMLIADSQENH
ncbi:7337_t:CDS:2 [Funneliformis geosporum]|uniref:11337_t:CDS:1 n=1 Tax=Funneliformis geosporum TaxID=1117311 RepID=A0A9W4SDF8_9GLOM|nr:7337_t:CDS:2 [Funneliformis geosporum]CAI2164533.1 11337_t:CDS:2 [Funneliformis geosporum]